MGAALEVAVPGHEPVLGAHRPEQDAAVLLDGAELQAAVLDLDRLRRHEPERPRAHPTDFPFGGIERASVERVLPHEFIAEFLRVWRTGDIGPGRVAGPGSRACSRIPPRPSPRPGRKETGGQGDRGATGHGREHSCGVRSEYAIRAWSARFRFRVTSGRPRSPSITRSSRPRLRPSTRPAITSRAAPAPSRERPPANPRRRTLTRCRPDAASRRPGVRPEGPTAVDQRRTGAGGVRCLLLPLVATVGVGEPRVRRAQGRVATLAAGRRVSATRREVLAEARTAFAYQGSPIHPAIVAHFCPSLHDGATPLMAVDVSLATGQQNYSEPVLQDRPGFYSTVTHREEDPVGAVPGAVVGPFRL